MTLSFIVKRMNTLEANQTNTDVWLQGSAFRGDCSGRADMSTLEITYYTARCEWLAISRFSKRLVLTNHTHTWWYNMSPLRGPRLCQSLLYSHERCLAKNPVLKAGMSIFHGALNYQNYSCQGNEQTESSTQHFFHETPVSTTQVHRWKRWIH